VAKDTILSIEALRSGYGRLEILHGVDLAIRDGEMICLLGPNGAGKSTLLRTIFGLTTYMSGSIRFHDREVHALRPRQLLELGIAYVPQGRCNFPLMSVQENLEMAVFSRRDREVKGDWERVYELFPRLRERHRQLAGNLSGGEQQMLEMAMAVLHRPRVLLVDEPSIGLAPAAIGEVFREIARLHADGRTIILVEQNTRKAMEVAERAVVLRLGLPIWNGPPHTITQAELGELFMTGTLPDPNRPQTGAIKHI